MSTSPVLRAVSLVLAHVPALVRLGSKPLRVLREVPEPVAYLRPHLRDWAAGHTHPSDGSPPSGSPPSMGSGTAVLKGG